MVKPGILKPEVNENEAQEMCVGGMANEHSVDCQGGKMVFLLAS